MTSRTITIINPSGLHARPASEFVAEAKKFGSSITIRDLSDENGEAVNAKSIVMLLTLGIGPGTKVEITAEGPDEEEAVGSLISLIESGFGELPDSGSGPSAGRSST
jgi:phosphocarrier protein